MADLGAGGMAAAACLPLKVRGIFDSRRLRGIFDLALSPAFVIVVAIERILN